MSKIKWASLPKGWLPLAVGGLAICLVAAAMPDVAHQPPPMLEGGCPDSASGFRQRRDRRIGGAWLETTLPEPIGPIAADGVPPLIGCLVELRTPPLVHYGTRLPRQDPALLDLVWRIIER